MLKEKKVLSTLKTPKEENSAPKLGPAPAPEKLAPPRAASVPKAAKREVAATAAEERAKKPRAASVVPGQTDQ